MIDTIVLRLHGLNRYDTLLKRLALKKKKGYKIRTGKINIEADRKLKEAGYDNTTQRLKILEMNKTGEFLTQTEVSKQVNSSGHYAFTYRIDMTNDYIEFNFSIPKYIYGSNIFQCVEHYHNRDFKLFENGTLLYNIKKSPGFFKSFIGGFFKKEFPLSEIDFYDLEINRIDFCFNQVFKTKEDALAILNYQKKLKKKHSRENDGNKTDYDTSFMYSTKRSSSKVYHKGSEYKKKDSKEHLKINDQKGYQYFNIKKLQEFADRILRYEVTIRSAEMNYLFKHNIFRRNCALFQIDYKNYLRIGNTKNRNERISKKIGSLPDSEKEAYRKLHPYEKINKEDRSTYDHVSHLMERKPFFMMKINEEEEKCCRQTVNYNLRFARFSTELVNLCLKKLIDFIEEFKIKELPNEERVALLIDDYNKTHKPKMQKSDLIQFYKLLVRHGSFKEAAANCGYERATLYRYKDRFKRIGITEKHMQPDKPCTIPQAPIDFKEYHSFLMHNNLLHK